MVTRARLNPNGQISYLRLQCIGFRGTARIRIQDEEIVTREQLGFVLKGTTRIRVRRFGTTLVSRLPIETSGISGRTTAVRSVLVISIRDILQRGPQNPGATAYVRLHSAKGGAVETGCSDLYDVIH